MSRRRGQRGHIERRGDKFYVRFWKDIEGHAKRSLACEYVCPALGPGKLTRSEQVRKGASIVIAYEAANEPRLRKIEAVSHGPKFHEQAEVWFERVTKRRIDPVRPSTAISWGNILENWANPLMGNMPLASVNNLALKNLVEKMVAKGRKPKTIRNVVQVVIAVVASAVNDEGEEIHPRKWNFKFMELPKFKAKDQRRPSPSGETVTKIIAEADDGQDKMIYALFAGSGLRAGEEYGLEIDKHISADRSTLVIEQTVCQHGGKLQDWTKTDYSEREVDLHPNLAAALKMFIGDRKSGFLFTSQSGKPMCQRNVLGRSLHPILKAIGHEPAGFHAFRRFRNTWLRKNRVHDDLIQFWLGHSPKTMTEFYSKLKEDVEFRKKMTTEVGLGFSLPPLEQFICTKVRKRRQRKGPAIVSQALVAA